jgi:putative flippase GtrA
MPTKSSCGEFEAYRLMHQGEKHTTVARCSRLGRWLKFNFVGALGIGVQFAVLFLLKSLLHFDYLVATAIAVEAAVMHNFVWHEQFTWVDRAKPDRRKLDRMKADRAGHNLARPGTAWLISTPLDATKFLTRRSLTRLVRFHLANGAASLLGNLWLMRVMVGYGKMNYLLANAIAIVMCSLANFLVSDEWVFHDAR